MKHEIGCGTAVVQNLLIRVALDSPRYLEDWFIDGRLPVATGAPRERTWQSALAQVMVESELLLIKTVSLCIIATIEHTRLDRGRTMLASGLDAELEETFILAIYREVASAFLSASLLPFTSHFLIYWRNLAAYLDGEMHLA